MARFYQKLQGAAIAPGGGTTPAALPESSGYTPGDRPTFSASGESLLSAISAPHRTKRAAQTNDDIILQPIAGGMAPRGYGL